MGGRSLNYSQKFANAAGADPCVRPYMRRKLIFFELIGSESGFFIQRPGQRRGQGKQQPEPAEIQHIHVESHHQVTGQGRIERQAQRIAEQQAPRRAAATVETVTQTSARRKIERFSTTVARNTKYSAARLPWAARAVSRYRLRPWAAAASAPLTANRSR